MPKIIKENAFKVNYSFIDKFLNEKEIINPQYVLVYLLVAKQIDQLGEADVIDISSKLNISITYTMAAITYFAEKAAINFSIEGSKISCTFNDFAESQNTKPRAKKIIKVQNHTRKNSLPIKNNTTEVTDDPLEILEDESKFKKIEGTCPTYSPQEIELYSRMDEVREMFERAEINLRRTLNSSDMMKIFSFYDWLRLPIPVIDILIQHCVKTSNHMSYIEQAALDWAQRGIDTPGAAKEYLHMYSKDFKDILRAFGISGRLASNSEQELMTKWLKVWGLPKDVIEFAADQTIMATGKISFTYADKILNEWHESGVTSVEIAATKIGDFKKKNQTPKPKSISKTPPQSSNNKYLNFKQRDYDFNGIKEEERARLRERFLETLDDTDLE